MPPRARSWPRSRRSSASTASRSSSEMIRIRYSLVGRIIAAIAAVILLAAYVLKPPGLIHTRALPIIYAVGLLVAPAFAGLILVARKPVAREARPPARF